MERPKSKGGSLWPFSGMESPLDEELITIEDGEDILVDDIAGIYETAVSLFKKGKYISSKRLFERIEAVIPEYKAARNYLSILDHKIKREQQALAGGHQKQSALSRQEERAEWTRILTESEQVLREKLIEQAKPLYRDATAQYKSRNFKLAKEYFVEVDYIFAG